MTDQTVPKPEPVPDGTTRFYWEAARDGQLLLQRCTACGFYLHPPDVACPRCRSEELEHVAASGRGVIYAVTVARQAFHQSFIEDVPYVLALVELEEQSGLRMLTNIVDAEPGTLDSGTPVRLTFEPRGEWALPQFRPAEGDGS